MHRGERELEGGGDGFGGTLMENIPEQFIRFHDYDLSQFG
jgi:hypothetical protein